MTSAKVTKAGVFFRSTNPNFNAPLPQEQWEIRHAAMKSGCGYFDVAHLVRDFTALVYKFPRAPGQAYGNIQDERDLIYIDAVHFRPWVYEEINNVLLNVLCSSSNQGTD